MSHSRPLLSGQRHANHTYRLAATVVRDYLRNTSATQPVAIAKRPQSPAKIPYIHTISRSLHAFCAMLVCVRIAESCANGLYCTDFHHTGRRPSHKGTWHYIHYRWRASCRTESVMSQTSKLSTSCYSPTYHIPPPSSCLPPKLHRMTRATYHSQDQV